MTVIGAAACAFAEPCGVIAVTALAVGGIASANTLFEGTTGLNAIVLGGQQVGIPEVVSSPLVSVLEIASDLVNPGRKLAGTLFEVGSARFGSSQLDNYLDVINQGNNALGHTDPDQ